MKAIGPQIVFASKIVFENPDNEVYIRTYIHTYVHTYIHTYVCTYVHTYIHTYTHTHICTLAHIHTSTIYLPSQAAKEHFSKLKEDYQKHVEKLTGLVDGGVDAVDFIRVSGVLLFIVM